MPKRNDLKTILIIGAGPIVIGQACEFDYSGVQACKALREEGYRVVLINSNPATIMTDPATADVTYIEPITWPTVEKIIAKEKPDAILPTMGGQTALNCALDLWRHGVLAKYNVELIGARPEAIDKAEDRLKFKEAMTRIGLESARSGIAHSMDEAWAVQKKVGFPTVIRPSFTLGGTGGGIAYNPEEFETICKRGLEASPTSELLIEESLLGWKEYEMEVVRDPADNCIIVCSIENLDPMGVHTGDSITVAPAQTLTDKEYQLMRDASIAILREIGVDTGGSNVQFSVNPRDGRMVVIEMNPRVSRSSALASKATGFPIAKIAAKLAVGYTLDELKNEVTGGATPASFEPTIDYVVTKIPRFAFEKFPAADKHLTTQMKSVGEVMAIGRTFQESFQKALRGLEVGVDGMNEKTQDRETLEKEFLVFLGTRFQAPPAISAVHVSGRRAHELARSGEKVSPSPRPVTITSLSEVTGPDPKGRITFSVKCHKGTYIRSLVRDLGNRLGCGAYVHSLKRLSIGRFCLDRSVSLSSLETGSGDAVLKFLLPLENLLEHFVCYAAPHDLEKDIRNGRLVQAGCLSRTHWGIIPESEHVVIRTGALASFALPHTAPDGTAFYRPDVVMCPEERS